MTDPRLDLIVACDRRQGIGKNGQLPWRLPGDLKYFSTVTTGKEAEVDPNNVVIMGRKTWQSIPEKLRPLKQRINIVLTKNPKNSELLTEMATSKESGVTLAESMEAAMQIAGQKFGAVRCFAIGGASVYSQAIEHPACDLLYLTEIEAEFDCDVFFPPFVQKFVPISKSEPRIDNGISYSFRVYKKREG